MTQELRVPCSLSSPAMLLFWEQEGPRPLTTQEVELLSVSLWYVSYPDPMEEEKEKKETLKGKDDNPGRDEKQRTTGHRTKPLRATDSLALAPFPSQQPVNCLPSLGFLTCRVISPRRKKLG